MSEYIEIEAPAPVEGSIRGLRGGWLWASPWVLFAPIFAELFPLAAVEDRDDFSPIAPQPIHWETMNRWAMLPSERLTCVLAWHCIGGLGVYRGESPDRVWTVSGEMQRLIYETGCTVRAVPGVVGAALDNGVISPDDDGQGGSLPLLLERTGVVVGVVAPTRLGRDF